MRIAEGGWVAMAILGDFLTAQEKVRNAGNQGLTHGVGGGWRSGAMEWRESGRQTRLGVESRKAKLSLGQSAENKSLSAAPQTYAI